VLTTFTFFLKCQLKKRHKRVLLKSEKTRKIRILEHWTTHTQADSTRLQTLETLIQQNENIFTTTMNHVSTAPSNRLRTV